MPEGESWQGLGGAALGAQAAQAWDSVPSESDSLGAIISTRKGVLKQQKCIVSQSWRLESEMEVLAGHTHWKAKGKVLPCPFQLSEFLEIPGVPGLFGLYHSNQSLSLVTSILCGLCLCVSPLIRTPVSGLRAYLLQ